jgi:hypothetical protein
MQLLFLLNWALSKTNPQAMNPLVKRVIAIDFVNTELKVEVRDPHTEWELRRSERTV